MIIRDHTTPTPDWSPTPQPWDEKACCPTQCPSCDIPPNIDCRKVHQDEQARARCERSHPAQTT